MRTDLAAAWHVRRQRFDIAIDLHGGPRSAWLTWASRAPTRIGYAIAGRSWMYTTVVPRAADLAPRHSVVNQWDLLRPLGIEPGDAGRRSRGGPRKARRRPRRSRRGCGRPASPTHTRWW